MAFQEILEFRSPTRLLHGPGALSRLPELLPSGTRVLVVTDNGLREAGVIDKVAAVLEEAEIDHTVFSDVLPNPPASCVEEGTRFFAEQECGALLGVGGGSPMDVAKMIGVLASHGGRIEEYLMAPGKITVDIPPLVCVPTTYGTGSEVTPFAVLTNPESRNKDPVVSWRIAPRAGILDAALCTALPAAVGGPTGMDALTHAIESYTNLMASPASDAIALEAMHLIGENLRIACANDHETEATQNMLLASAMAGIAFSQTRLGNVHAMSHPVGAQFGVHHGLANAVLLPYVMEFNLVSRGRQVRRRRRGARGRYRRAGRPGGGPPPREAGAAAQRGPGDPGEAGDARSRGERHRRPGRSDHAERQRCGKSAQDHPRGRRGDLQAGDLALGPSLSPQPAWKALSGRARARCRNPQ